VEASVEAGKPYIPALKRPEVKSAGIAAFSRSPSKRRRKPQRAPSRNSAGHRGLSPATSSAALALPAVAFAPAAAHEPSTWAMMLMGFLGLRYFGHKARRGNVLQAAFAGDGANTASPRALSRGRAPAPGWACHFRVRFERFQSLAAPFPTHLTTVLLGEGAGCRVTSSARNEKDAAHRAAPHSAPLSLNSDSSEQGTSTVPPNLS